MAMATTTKPNQSQLVVGLIIGTVIGGVSMFALSYFNILRPIGIFSRQGGGRGHWRHKGYGDYDDDYGDEY